MGLLESPLRLPNSHHDWPYSCTRSTDQVHTALLSVVPRGSEVHGALATFEWSAWYGVLCTRTCMLQNAGTGNLSSIWPPWISITFFSRSASDIPDKVSLDILENHHSGRHNSPCFDSREPCRLSLAHEIPPHSPCIIGSHPGVPIGGSEGMRGVEHPAGSPARKGSRSVAASENGLQNPEILVRFRWGRRTHGLEQGHRRGPVPGRSRGTPWVDSSSWTRSAPNPLSGQHAC